MEEFELKGQDGFLIIRIKEVFDFPNKTSPFGGYDCILGIEIRVGNYNVTSQFYSTTAALFDFYKKIEVCQSQLNGLAEFDSHEKNLKLTAKYTFGNVTIWGKYQENGASENLLKFEFNSDQSYLQKTLDQLNQIVNKYGGFKGVADR